MIPGSPPDFNQSPTFPIIPIISTLATLLEARGHVELPVTSARPVCLSTHLRRVIAAAFGGEFNRRRGRQTSAAPADSCQAGDASVTIAEPGRANSSRRPCSRGNQERGTCADANSNYCRVIVSGRHVFPPARLWLCSRQTPFFPHRGDKPDL